MSVKADFIDFEGPDYVADGPLGNGWATTSYNNQGDLSNVTTTSPLAGLQSAAFANVNGFGDMWKSTGQSFSDAGPGDDFAISFLQTMSTSGGRSAFALSNDGNNGNSPILLRIDGGNAEVWQGGGDYQSVGNYTLGNTLEWNVTADISGGTFAVSIRDVTAGSDFSSPVTFITQDGGFVDGGTPDYILAPRIGDSAFDNLSVTNIPEPTTGVMLLAGTVLAMWRRRPDKAVS